MNFNVCSSPQKAVTRHKVPIEGFEALFKVYPKSRTKIVFRHGNGAEKTVRFQEAARRRLAVLLLAFRLWDGQWVYSGNAIEIEFSRR